jgi:hypothetical protein
MMPDISQMEINAIILEVAEQLHDSIPEEQMFEAIKRVLSKATSNEEIMNLTQEIVVTDADFVQSMLKLDGVTDAAVWIDFSNSCTLRVKIPSFDLLLLSKITKHLIRLYGNQVVKPEYDSKNGWLSLEVRRLK